MKKIAITVTVLALFTTSLFGQTPPSTGGGGSGGGDTTPVPYKVPLASPNVLKAFALTIVGPIRVQVYDPYGDSVSGNAYAQTNYPFTDADPDKMAQIAGSLSLRFSAPVDSRLASGVSYNSRPIKLTEPDGAETSPSFNLFNGSKAFKLEYYKDSWMVPAEARKVELEIGQVPFVVPGMRDAHITTRDENGNPTGDYNFRQQQGDYWLDRGLIFLNEDMTSLNGELTLNMKDGSNVIYDLCNDGYRKPTATVQAVGFKPTIKGIRTVPDNTTDIVYEATDEIIRAAATIQLKAHVSFPPMLERYPIKVCVIGTKYLAAHPNARWLEFNPYVEPVQFSYGDGTVLIRFEYPSDPQPLDNTDGGKGVSEATPVTVEGK